jgi:hypothetical protein
MVEGFDKIHKYNNVLEILSTMRERSEMALQGIKFAARGIFPINHVLVENIYIQVKACNTMTCRGERSCHFKLLEEHP